MAKKKAKAEDADFEEKLFWYLATAYIADCLGVLNPDKKLKLAHLGEQYGGEMSWREHVEQSLGIDAEFVREFAALGMRYGKTPPQIFGFLLAGFGCPEPGERMIEVMG